MTALSTHPVERLLLHRPLIARVLGRRQNLRRRRGVARHQLGVVRNAHQANRLLLMTAARGGGLAHGRRRQLVEVAVDGDEPA